MRCYCYACNQEVEAQLAKRKVTRNIDGIKLTYDEQVLLCPVCGNEIYDAALSDRNIQTANELYRRSVGLITVAEIGHLFSKYNIGEKPLAQLLGWGEVTLVRYCKGAMPSKPYSDLLQSLDNPYVMLRLLKTNGSVLTSTARKKLASSIAREIGFIANKVFQVANFFLHKVNEEAGDFMTPLKLQKMVCLAQGWSLGFLGRPLFNQEIQAWQHGPVVYDLYEAYKAFKFNPIPALNSFDSSCFKDEEIAVLEMINDIFGVYNATFLENLTHKERPWQIVRKGLKDTESSQMIIAQDELRKYYQDVMKKYDIVTVKDTSKIESYLRDVCKP